MDDMWISEVWHRKYLEKESKRKARQFFLSAKKRKTALQKDILHYSGLPHRNLDLR